MRSIVVIILCFQAIITFGQEKYYYVNLDVNKPLANTNWIKNTTASGFRAGIRGFINEKFSAGVDVGVANFHQYLPTTTTQTGNTSITTDYFKYLYSISIAGSGQYNLRVGDGETFFPYAGLGLGALNNQYVRYYNAYTDKDKSWGFLARPEAGILVKFTKYRSIGAMAAVHYDFATNKSNLFNYNSFSSVGFQIGIMFLEL